MESNGAQSRIRLNLGGDAAPTSTRQPAWQLPADRNAAGDFDVFERDDTFANLRNNGTVVPNPNRGSVRRRCRSLRRYHGAVTVPRPLVSSGGNACRRFTGRRIRTEFVRKPWQRRLLESADSSRFKAPTATGVATQPTRLTTRLPISPSAQGLATSACGIRRVQLLPAAT